MRVTGELETWSIKYFNAFSLQIQCKIIQENVSALKSRKTGEEERRR